MRALIPPRSAGVRSARHARNITVPALELSNRKAPRLVSAQVRPNSGGVPAREFLTAAYGIITLFDSLPGMGVVKSDMLGNADALWRGIVGTTLEQVSQPPPRLPVTRTTHAHHAPTANAP